MRLDWFEFYIFFFICKSAGLFGGIKRCGGLAYTWMGPCEALFECSTSSCLSLCCLFSALGENDAKLTEEKDVSVAMKRTQFYMAIICA